MKDTLDRTDLLRRCLNSVAESALAGNPNGVVLTVTKAVRDLRAADREVADRLGELLVAAGAASGLRWAAAGPPPIDQDEGLSLLKAEPTDSASKPVLAPVSESALNSFLKTRLHADRLLAAGVLPPSSLLLSGPPGTGKTMTARWLARQSGLPMVTLDLSTSISSYLGKTGLNLRRTLDFARSKPCLLLLDEFDAIAKRRDDRDEVGELKRVVNVLLKELEDWPCQGILVAATNHPELLDVAIARRFDLSITFELPDIATRARLLRELASPFLDSLPKRTVAAFAQACDGSSGSALRTITHRAICQHVIEELPMERCLVEVLMQCQPEAARSSAIGELVRAFDGSGLTRRELAKMFGKSVSTIQHHLNHQHAKVDE